MWVLSLGWEDLLEEGNQLQYSCLENTMDRGDWWATVHRVAQSWTRLRRKWQPAPVFLPGESQGRWAAVYGVAQSRIRLKRLSSSSIRSDLTCLRLR